MRAYVTEPECRLCGDFGDLAPLGPCPACRPDAYTEHLAALRRCANFTEQAHPQASAKEGDRPDVAS